ncbi:polysaccharide biosynthesis tyrosine autokinase [Dysgonomonas sp. OttesenSCG-928-M03]|nr:polysaccharide biosynthesis tyrosine autokinase [Dysgonomonas sp. OttesenSCG-928-M03]
MKAKSKSDFIDVGDIIVKYSKYWKWFLLSLLLTIFIGIIYIKIVDPTYYISSSVKLRTEEEGSKIATSLVKSFGLGGMAGTDNIDDEAIIISSQSHMRDMIYSLGLHVSYDLKKFPFDKSLYDDSPLVLTGDRSVIDTLTDKIKFEVKVNTNKSVDIKAKSDGNDIGNYTGNLPAQIKTKMGSFILSSTGKSIDTDEYKMDIVLSGLNYSAEQFREKVEIGAADNKSNLIYLGLKETNKKRGKDVLNKLIELYNADTKDEKNQEAINTDHFIRERISLLASELSVLEKQLEDFKKKNNVLNLDAESRAFISKYQDLQERNTEIEIQQNIAGMLNKYVSDPANRHELIPTNTGVPSNTLEAIRSYNAAILERSRLLQNTKESNPIIISLDKQIDMLRQNVQTSVGNAQKDIAVRKKDWAGLTGEMQSKMSQMPQQEREYIELERQRQVKSELYVFLLTKMEETQLTLASTTPKAKIIDDAYSVWKPVAPKKKNVFGLALLLGIAIPVVVIYLMDIFKVKLQTKEELEQATSIPVLGEICLDKNGKNIAVSEGITTSTAELFRLVRTNLQFLMKKDEKVMLVTSSISGEGKSFFTVNLALSFSLIKNKKVALVGLDIRNPKLSEYLSISKKDGITLYLASDDMKPEEIIIHRPDLHPNIYVVPAGPIPPNPSELLLGDRLEEFFTYLRENFDYIIVDTAPVGMVSDTFSLDRISDIAVYLFRANYTNKSYIKLAESIVEENKLKRLSFVINGTTTKSAYGYGYGNK